MAELEEVLINLNAEIRRLAVEKGATTNGDAAQKIFYLTLREKFVGSPEAEEAFLDFLETYLTDATKHPVGRVRTTLIQCLHSFAFNKRKAHRYFSFEHYARIISLIEEGLIGERRDQIDINRINLVGILEDITTTWPESDPDSIFHWDILDLAEALIQEPEALIRCPFVGDMARSLFRVLANLGRGLNNQDNDPKLRVLEMAFELSFLVKVEHLAHLIRKGLLTPTAFENLRDVLLTVGGDDYGATLRNLSRYMNYLRHWKKGWTPEFIPREMERLNTYLRFLRAIDADVNKTDLRKLFPIPEDQMREPTLDQMRIILQLWGKLSASNGRGDLA